MPLFDEMNASLQRVRGKGRHHISKSIYLRKLKVIDLDSCSASQNLSEKYYYMSQCEMGVQVNKYRLDYTQCTIHTRFWPDVVAAIDLV